MRGSWVKITMGIADTPFMATLTTGILGGGLKGTSGNAVFVQTAHGTVVRERTIPHDPRTPAQIAVRMAQGRAARAWSDLDPAAVAAWRAYAATLGRQPNNAFATLYKVLLRLNPTAPAPLKPPTRPFFGDVISASAAGALSGVTFTATGSNAAGVVTELLLQPLASRHRRTYRDKYRHAAFVAFSGTLTKTVACAPGWIACAYRFVNANTGQVTEIAELGVVREG